MKSVKVTELRQNLPAYLAKVRKGESFRVTSRGRAIGTLVPPAGTTDEADAARKRLRGSVVRYVDPLDPVLEPGDWEMNK